MRFIKNALNNQKLEPQRYGTKTAFYKSNYGLNPREADARDKYSLQNIKGKSYGDKMQDKHCLQRYDFFPGALTPAQAIAMSERKSFSLWPTGKRKKDIGKTSRSYTRAEIDSLHL
eukprot:863158_1